MNNFSRYNRYGFYYGANNLQDRPVPLFSCRNEDKADLNYIHSRSLYCVVFGIAFLPCYIFGIIAFAVGLVLYLSNVYGSKSQVDPSYDHGMLALWIIGVIVFFGIIAFAIIRVVLEWRIAKRNNTLLKYYDKLDNSIISRYMYVCQKNTYLLWSILLNIVWGTIIDFWLIKESRRILNLPNLSEEEEKQQQNVWIEKFVKMNSMDERIQNAYMNYLNINPNNFNNPNNPNIYPKGFLKTDTKQTSNKEDSDDSSKQDNQDKEKLN